MCISDVCTRFPSQTSSLNEIFFSCNKELSIMAVVCKKPQIDTIKIAGSVFWRWNSCASICSGSSSLCSTVSLASFIASRNRKLFRYRTDTSVVLDCKNMAKSIFFLSFFNKTPKSRNTMLISGFLAAHGPPRVNRPPDFIQWTLKLLARTLVIF